MIVRRKSSSGRQVVVEAPSGGLRYLRLETAFLEPGGRTTIQAAAREYAIVVLTGRADIIGETFAFSNIGERMNVFDGPPFAAYLPPHHGAEIEARSNLELAVWSAPAQGAYDAALVTPDDITVVDIGRDAWSRRGCFIVGDQVRAERLLVGETHLDAAKWGGFPPHRHDRDVPGIETELEEIYLYRTEPNSGFGFHLRYDTDLADAAINIVYDGDVATISNGYHPCIAGPGSRLYYHWGQAGERRQWLTHDDPTFAWAGIESVHDRD
jgi:5-deoxy-glucuronate isomerase